MHWKAETQTLPMGEDKKTCLRLHCIGVCTVGVYVLCTWVGSDGSFDELGIQVGHADAHSVALLGFLYILAEHLQALHFLLNLVENI